MKKVLLFSMALSTGLMLSSCDKDDDFAKPEILSIEYGSSHDESDDHSAYQGGDMHIEAEIEAEAKIDYIKVELHPEGEDGHDHDDEWEFEETYTDGFSGLKNTTFHKHIEIDEHVEPGEYHFHFIVVDMEGNQATYEGDVVILEAHSEIVVENLSVNGGEHHISKSSGSFIVSFDASVQQGTLASYKILAHSEPESGNEEDEFLLIDEEYTEDFSGLTSANVNQTITIDTDAPLGEYHLEIVIIDSNGNEKVVSDHFDLED